MHIELLWGLRSKHKGLHESPHRLAIIRELSGDLHDNARSNGGLRIDLSDLGVAVLEAERSDLLVDLELTDNRLLDVAAAVRRRWSVDAAVHECAAARVEAVQQLGRLVQHRVVLSHELSAYLLRTGLSHDHDDLVFV